MEDALEFKEMKTDSDEIQGNNGNFLAGVLRVFRTAPHVAWGGGGGVLSSEASKCEAPMSLSCPHGRPRWPPLATSGPWRKTGRKVPLEPPHCAAQPTRPAGRHRRLPRAQQAGVTSGCLSFAARSRVIAPQALQRF